MTQQAEQVRVGPSYPAPDFISKPPWGEAVAEGRVNAIMLARLLDWSASEMAEYLGKSASALSKQPASRNSQRALLFLIAVLNSALALTGGNMEALLLWLQTPQFIFDDLSAKDMIIRGELRQVADLIREFEAGTVA